MSVILVVVVVVVVVTDELERMQLCNNKLFQTCGFYLIDSKPYFDVPCRVDKYLQSKMNKKRTLKLLRLRSVTEMP